MSASKLCIAIRLSWQTTPAKSLVIFEHVAAQRIVRVAQPPDQTSYAGNPAGAANRGRFLLVTFLGKTRKVTCCRATPGEVFFKQPEACKIHAEYQLEKLPEEKQPA
jgi:hypothetical protein